MLIRNKERQAIKKMDPKNRLITFCFLVLVFVAVLVSIFSLRDALQALGDTYPGFMVGKNCMVVLYGGEDAAKLKTFDRILAVDGDPVTRGGQVLDLVRRKDPGDRVTYQIQRDDKSYEVQIPCRTYTEREILYQFFFAFITGAVFLLVGILVMTRSPRKTVSWILFLLTFSLGTVFITLFSAYYLHRFFWLNTVMLFLAPAMIIHFGARIRLLDEDPRTRRYRPAVLVSSYALAVLALGIFFWGFYRWQGPFLNPFAFILYYFLAVLLYGFGWDLHFLLSRPHPIVRYYSRIMRFGAVVGLLPFVAVILLNYLFDYSTPIFPFSLITIFYALILAYVAFSYNLFEFNRFLRQGTIRLLVLVIVVGCYGLMMMVANRIFLEDGSDSFLLLTGYITLVVLIFGPLETGINRILERTLFRSSLLYRETVEQSAGLIATLLDKKKIESELQKISDRVVEASSFRLFYRDGPIFRTPDRESDEPCVLTPENELVRSLGEIRNSLTRRDLGEGILENSTGVLSEFERLGAELIVPISFQSQVLGIFCLGPKKFDKLYQKEDLDLLETLADQVASALINVQTYEAVDVLNREVEEHLREMEGQREEISRLQNRLKDENVYLKQEIGLKEGFEEIIGDSPALHEALSLARRAAGTDSTVLITGESGTGKELAAHAIHNLSDRRERIFVRVNCAAVPEGLIESELFGHERGAFTGAVNARKGRFELADGGSILLDEIGEFPLPLQAKLLRVLQEQEFERVGGSRTLRVNVRVMASTNRDLAEMVRQGTFREDLYWRLNVVQVQMPALRERREDLPELANHFIKRHNVQMGKKVEALDPEALQELEAYPWPGNVRELANVMERAMVLNKGEVIRLEDLPLSSLEEVEEEEGFFPLQEYLDRERERAILAALRQTGGNQAQAAVLLGLHRSNLSRMIKRLGLKVTKGGYVQESRLT